MGEKCKYLHKNGKTIQENYSYCSAYNGAVQDDLFDALQDALEAAGKLDLLPPGISVKQVMDTWTLQTGYPLVRVSRRNNTLTLSQVNTLEIFGKIRQV